MVKPGPVNLCWLSKTDSSCQIGKVLIVDVGNMDTAMAGLQAKATGLTAMGATSDALIWNILFCLNLWTVLLLLVEADS